MTEKVGHRAIKTHLVSLDGGVGDLGDDVLVGRSYDQSVLGSVVLVLVLDYQTLPGGIWVVSHVTNFRKNVARVATYRLHQQNICLDQYILNDTLHGKLEWTDIQIGMFT